jgi:hypothetical protein
VPVYEYECGSCKSPRRPTRTDYLFRRRTINDDGTWTDHGETPPETVPCRKCQSPAKRIVSAPKFRMAKYGFVDESAMNRHYEANGLARTEDAGSWIDQQVARVMAEEEASEREFQEYVDKFDNAPDFADARRLRDAGYFADQAASRAEKNTGLTAEQYGGVVENAVSNK